MTLTYNYLYSIYFFLSNSPTWNQTLKRTFPTLHDLRNSSGTARTKPLFLISSFLIL